jgi:hypothetical protein
VGSRISAAGASQPADIGPRRVAVHPADPDIALDYQLLAPPSTHFFNHQAHHPGKAYVGLTIVRVRESVALELLILCHSG